MDRRRFGIWMALSAAALPFAGLAAAPTAPAKPGAHDWPNWRGPQFNGSSEETGLPVKFSGKEGVRWVADLPGPSAGTPVICGDRVYLSAADVPGKRLLALCLDRKTGKILWQHSVGSGHLPAGQGTPIQVDEKSYYSSPSAVTDGKHVVFFYGNGDLVGFDPDGTKLWARNIQKEFGDFCFNWTFSSTPQLYDGRLYLQVLQRDIPVSGRGKENTESFLLCVDPATGKDQWRHVRVSPARMASREAYSTPIPYEHDGVKELIIAGGDLITGHDPATGKELWRWGTWNPAHVDGLRVIPSPVVGAGIVLVCAPKREPAYAVRLNGKGDLPDSALAWKSDARVAGITSDVPTPLFYRGKFYILSDLKKNLTCVEPSDGKVLWSTPLAGPTTCWGSPTGADGKIYLMSLRTEVHVLDAEKGTLLATNPMTEDDADVRSTVAVAHGCLFIRTNSKLFCVGSAAP